MDTQYQTMAGFGASDAWRTQFVGTNWPLEKREKMADLLFSLDLDPKGNPKGIGLSMWRFYIGSGSTEQGDSSFIQNVWRRSECFLNADGSYDWNKQLGQKWFLQAAKERGLENFIAFSISAPTHYTINSKAWSIKGDERINLKPGYWDDYAKFLVDVVEHFDKKEGITFNYLSPINEPQWDWSKASQEGTAATNEGVYLFTRYLSNELESREMSTQLIIAEAADLRHLASEYHSSGNQIEHFFSKTSPLYVGNLFNIKDIISGHSYFTTWPVDSLFRIRERLASKLNQVEGIDYWQTEFSILEQSPEIGSGHVRDLGMATALYVVRVIHSDLTIANAASWQWWTALTTWDYKDGLLYLDTGDPTDLFNRDKMQQDGEVRESKLLWAFGNYSRFVRPGMTRIKATIDDASEKVSISAYADRENNITVILTNHDHKKRKLKLPGGFQVRSSYLTDESHNLDLVDLDARSIVLPPRSITTILGN